MSQLAYEFLNDSFLFNEVLLDNNFDSISEKELHSEIQKYREFCLTKHQKIEEELSSNASSLKIFSGTHSPNIELLKQSALYIEQFLISDPLFSISEEKTATDSAFSKLLSMEPPVFSREHLIKQINYLKIINPMVKAGYVKVFPTTFFFERPKQVPYLHSKTGFADSFPESLLDFFHDNSIVESVKNNNGVMIIDGSFELGRGIQVRFKEHADEDARVYILKEEKILSVDKKRRTVESIIYIPNNLPDEEAFKRWVFQSINQTAGHLYKRALFEIELAIRFDASYLCKTPFLFELLKQFIPLEEKIETNTVNTLLNFDVPFMDRIDIETLMSVRLNDGEAFQNFRIELDKQLKQLRMIDDPKELKIKTENVFHEINEVQVNQIKQKMKQIKRQVPTDVLLALGGLVGAIQTGGWSLIATALATIKGYKSYADYVAVKEQNPSFFLWKVLNTKK